MLHGVYKFLAIAIMSCVCRVTGAQEPPTIPVGLDAYRQWERWPYLRIGQQTYMRSTYDRRGGNESADASHFLFQLDGERNVSLDLEGPGVLNFVRYNHWHGSPWHYIVDGTDFTVKETSTAKPDHPVEGSTFLPANLFPEPLAWTWATTRGADLIGVPIPFTRSFRMEYDRTHYGTGYYIFSRYVPGAKLSQPLTAWDGKTPPAKDVLALVARAGSDLVSQPGTPEGRKQGIRERHGVSAIAAGSDNTICSFDNGPGMVRAIEFSVPRAQALTFGAARLTIAWDGGGPSVDAPAALFFGAGSLYNRDGREYLVKAFPVNIRFDAERVHLACYFPMPYTKSAVVRLHSPSSSPLSDIRWSIRTAPFRDRAEQVGYFHATYRDHPHPEPGKDLVLLDTREIGPEGAPRSSTPTDSEIPDTHWSGHIVGTSFIFSHNANLGTLEGDPRFFFDDSKTPQVQGTGTEEWGGGGDYWGGLNMTLPFVGHPVGARNLQAAKSDEDKIESAYRFLLSDLMPFGRNARICLEHGGTNESTEHYESVVYWYGRPGATLVKTDELDIGNPADEKLHDYNSPQSTAPYDLSSRYEWGVDHLDGREIYPEETDRGRVTSGECEFTLNLDPKNVGVLLRRKLDYAYPNQRAEVYVEAGRRINSAVGVWHSASGSKHSAMGIRRSKIQTNAKRQMPDTQWRFAGIWYLAGSNTCVFSNPKEELGPAQHNVQTSNRRFRDDDFLLPRDLTRGRKSIRVRIKFTPVSRPLYPGYPVPQLGWSEMRYTAYCYVYPIRPLIRRQSNSK